MTPIYPMLVALMFRKDIDWNKDSYRKQFQILDIFTGAKECSMAGKYPKWDRMKTSYPQQICTGCGTIANVPSRSAFRVFRACCDFCVIERMQDYYARPHHFINALPNYLTKEEFETLIFFVKDYIDKNHF